MELSPCSSLSDPNSTDKVPAATLAPPKAPGGVGAKD